MFDTLVRRYDKYRPLYYVYKVCDYILKNESILFNNIDVTGIQHIKELMEKFSDHIMNRVNDYIRDGKIIKNIQNVKDIKVNDNEIDLDNTVLDISKKPRITISFNDLVSSLDKAFEIYNNHAEQFNETITYPKLEQKTYIGESIKYSNVINNGNQRLYNDIDKIDNVTNDIANNKFINDMLNSGLIVKQNNNYVYDGVELDQDQVLKIVNKARIQEILTRSRSALTNMQKQNRATQRAIGKAERLRRERYIAINKSYNSNKSNEQKEVDKNKGILNNGYKINPLLLRSNLL